MILNKITYLEIPSWNTVHSAQLQAWAVHLIALPGKENLTIFLL